MKNIMIMKPTKLAFLFCCFFVYSSLFGQLGGGGNNTFSVDLTMINSGGGSDLVSIKIAAQNECLEFVNDNPTVSFNFSLPIPKDLIKKPELIRINCKLMAQTAIGGPSFIDNYQLQLGSETSLWSVLPGDSILNGQCQVNANPLINACSYLAVFTIDFVGSGPVGWLGDAIVWGLYIPGCDSSPCANLPTTNETQNGTSLARIDSKSIKSYSWVQKGDYGVILSTSYSEDVLIELVDINGRRISYEILESESGSSSHSYLIKSSQFIKNKVYFIKVISLSDIDVVPIILH